ncbi:uncharacterized protein LOC117549735 [Gymnodraco acuticeps]|uniref:Uncharacterized protein LOC117549735 n=1 Tax=Gymnodraco acuticeps TaxID=8218 RepID=A0A6P8UKW9_GYMAC|nr:uncharacterized protein LOC117549735 [Gymnodraco acuticeps]XP_034077709.1 uncharacterized protein LOC117549735 [Gymnodraco acuticeps]XP_034077716.1 uncharacterized protein LOC117549735 [Gymnodraco acuticeps]
MGKSNSKKVILEYEGCAKVMCNKHGAWTCTYLNVWVKNGFPDNGSLSLNQLEKLRQGLEKVEKKHTKRNMGWKAFGMWKTEAMIRENQKNKGEQGGGVIKPQCARIPLGKVDGDLDCPSGCQIQAPDLPELDAPGPHRVLHSPPPYDEQRVEQTTAKLYPDLPSPTAQPVASRTRQQAERDFFVTSPTAKGCKAPLEPQASVPEHTLNPEGPSSSWATVQDMKDSCILMPMVEVPNPRGDANDPQIMYVFRPWSPGDMKDVINDLPNPVESGGVEFGAQLLELIQQHRPSLRELERLLIGKLKLKWGAVKGDWPGVDHRYDWANAAPYRLKINGLIQRLENYYQKRMDWGKVKDCAQRVGESVTDTAGWCVLLVTMTVHMNSRKKTCLMEGLLPEIKKYVQKHCIELERGRLEPVLTYARHAEKVMNNANEELKTIKNKMGERLQMAQLQAYEQQINRGRGKRRGGYRGRERAPSRGKGRGYEQRGCFRGGSFEHRIKDCPEEEEEEMDDEWQHGPEEGVTVSHPQGRKATGGRGQRGL